MCSAAAIDFCGAGTSGAINIPILGGLQFRFDNLVINPLWPAVRAPGPCLPKKPCSTCVGMYVSDDIILLLGENWTPTPISWTGKERQEGTGGRWWEGMRQRAKWDQERGTRKVEGTGQEIRPLSALSLIPCCGTCRQPL